MKSFIACLYFITAVCFQHVSLAQDPYKLWKDEVAVGCAGLFKPVGDSMFPDPYDFKARVVWAIPPVPLINYKKIISASYNSVCRYLITVGKNTHRAGIDILVSKDREKAENFMNLKQQPVLTFKHRGETYYMAGQNLEMQFFVMGPS